MKHTILTLLFCTGFAFAEATPFVSLLLGPEENVKCISALKDLSEYRLLLALPEYHSFIETKIEADLRAKLKSWSSDLLLRIYAQIDSEFLYVCPKAISLEKTRDLVGRQYLASLGIGSEKMTAAEIQTLVHGLVILKEDLGAVQAKVKKLKPGLKGLTLLRKVFGSAESLDGVAIVSGQKISLAKIKALLREFCGEEKLCPFWHPSSLWKVVLTEERGIASYVPEIRTLVLSSELVEEPNLLMKVVVLHELAHSAESYAWNLTREKWVDVFREFSGWNKTEKGWDVPVKKMEKPRSDLLTELSKGALYSILPDDIYVPKDNTKEGFVFSKSYVESKKRDDPSEDLADSISAYKLAPNRFCLEGKLALPRKAGWIHQNVLPSQALPQCKP